MARSHRIEFAAPCTNVNARDPADREGRAESGKRQDQTLAVQLLAAIERTQVGNGAMSMNRLVPSLNLQPELSGAYVATALAVAMASLLGACAQPSPPQQSLELVAIEQRLHGLEQRFDTLERFLTNLPALPLRNRAEIQKNIQSLESKRTALLERYTSAHPYVREVDLSLRLLKLQLEFLDQASAAPK